MSRKRNVMAGVAGILIGMALAGPAAHAAENYLKAYRSTQAVYLDGRQVQMEAYNINNNNYVKLRDIGQAVGFNVYWQDGVPVDSDAPYTGQAPASAGAGSDTSTDTSGAVTLPSDGSQYIPRLGM